MNTAMFIMITILFWLTVNKPVSTATVIEEKRNPILRIIKIKDSKCLTLGRFNSCTAILDVEECVDGLWGKKKIPSTTYARVEGMSESKTVLSINDVQIMLKNKKGVIVSSYFVASGYDCMKDYE